MPKARNIITKRLWGVKSCKNVQPGAQTCLPIPKARYVPTNRLWGVKSCQNVQPGAQTCLSMFQARNILRDRADFGSDRVQIKIFNIFENFEFFRFLENFMIFELHLLFEPQGARNGIRVRYYHRWIVNCSYFLAVEVPRTVAVCAHIRHTTQIVPFVCHMYSQSRALDLSNEPYSVL